MKRKKSNDPVSANLISIHERIASMQTDIAWLKDLVKKLDRRTWTILAGIIVSILVSIAMRLI